MPVHPDVRDSLDWLGGGDNQIDHPEFRHGDYFFVGNYKESWIPFLRTSLRARFARRQSLFRTCGFGLSSGSFLISLIVLFILRIFAFI